MKYKNFTGKLIDTDKDEVECSWCNEVISKKTINNGDIYHDGVSNPKTGENWCELMHKNCSEEAIEWRRNKYGY
ncbi:type II restriction endonuclease subunit M [Clostridium botulinum]|uniref:type II restriction endonuclease subunit M n=1 Tax=Clostridium botulinum TaxID=1491 RepID=UPI001967EDEA|nr:type II restriction endonuclease subunit M [Clostridium botulinum]MBN1043767.1 type II restriction endonuclease subunit M [Clostridium botulinum]